MPARPALADADTAHRLLADDGEVGLDVPLADDEARALRAADLLVGHLGDDQLALERYAGTFQGDGGHNLRGDARLIVARTAPVDAPMMDFAAKRRIDPGRGLADRHHIDVRIEREARPCAHTAQGSDDVRLLLVPRRRSCTRSPWW